MEGLRRPRLRLNVGKACELAMSVPFGRWAGLRCAESKSWDKAASVGRS